MADFGIVTACHRGDYPLAKAACASIRYFMPDVPICVIVDGDLSIRELEDLYGVIPLRVSEFADPRLQRLCAGSTRSKLAAIWEAPFERFVCFDSDVVVWGDIREKIDLQKNDFVKLTNLLAQERDRENITHFMYHPERIREVRPDFNWIGKWFFCAGAFAARKGCLVLEEYLALEEFSSRSPGVFRFYEQGILNFMVQTYKMDNRMRVGVADLQFIVVDHPRAEVEGRFGRSWAMLPREIREPTLIHFCGEKPWIQNHRAYHAPFTACRFFHYQNLLGANLLGRARSWLAILKEELAMLATRSKNKLYPKRNIDKHRKNLLFHLSKPVRLKNSSQSPAESWDFGRSGKAVADFGVITACHAGDYFMAKATCASIRHFMPDVPICVIVDGDFSIKELEETYGVIPLPVGSFSDARLRKLCRGSPKSKWGSVWESPFKRMLILDCDIVAWGDLLKDPMVKERDFVMMSPFIGSADNKEDIVHYFYDVDRLPQWFPDFRWEGMPFFCAGAYAMRRNLFPVDSFLRVEELASREPGLFKFNDQGILNFLVHRAMQEKTIDVGINELQYIVVDHPREETLARYGSASSRIPESVEHPAALHFCGVKPLLQNVKAWHAPFTAFRWRHYQNVYGNKIADRLKALTEILSEEWLVLRKRLKQRLNGQKWKIQ